MPMSDTLILIGEVAALYCLLMGLLILARWRWPTVYFRTYTMDEVKGNMKCPHCGESHHAPL